MVGEVKMTVRTQRALKSLSKVIDTIDKSQLIEQAALVPHVGARLVTTLEAYGIERIKSDIAEMLRSTKVAVQKADLTTTTTTTITSSTAKKTKAKGKVKTTEVEQFVSKQFTTRKSTWEADFKAVDIDLEHRERVEKELLSSVKAASRRANRFTCIRKFGKALDRDHVATVTVNKGSITVVYGKMSALGYCITRGRATFII